MVWTIGDLGYIFSTGIDLDYEVIFIKYTDISLEVLTAERMDPLILRGLFICLFV